MATEPQPSHLTAEQLQSIVDQSPFMATSGMRIIRADPATATVELHAPFVPALARGYTPGQWHGGTIAATIDTVGDFALAMALGRPIPTISLHVDYLRPAIDTALHATAIVRRQGRTVGVVDIDVRSDNGTLLAIGRATYATA